MSRIGSHLRNKFIAGIFAAIPAAVTAFIVWYADSNVRSLTGLKYPFVGIAIAIGGIYVLGLFVTSFLGKFFLGFVDKLLSHLPGLRELYGAWKQVALTEEAGGVFNRVCLIPDEGADMWMMGFTTGKPIENDPEFCCVFVPASPNPASGRLFIAPMRTCVFLELAPREAFKMILSGGNYVPKEIGAATRTHRLRSPPASGSG